MDRQRSGCSIWISLGTTALPVLRLRASQWRCPALPGGTGWRCRRSIQEVRRQPVPSARARGDARQCPQLSSALGGASGVLSFLGQATDQPPRSLAGNPFAAYNSQAGLCCLLPKNPERSAGTQAGTTLSAHCRPAPHLLGALQRAHSPASPPPPRGALM